MMTGTFLARESHFDDSCPRILSRERLIEQLHRSLGLLLQGFGKFCSAPTREIGIPFFIKRLTYDNKFHIVFRGKIRHLCGIHQTRNMLEDGQWAGNGGGGVAERETDPFFTVVNCKDSHKDQVEPLRHEDTENFIIKNLSDPVSLWLGFFVIASLPQYEMARSAPRATTMEIMKSWAHLSMEEHHPILTGRQKNQDPGSVV